MAIGPGSSNALSGLKSRKANIVVEDRGKFDLRGMGTEAARGGKPHHGIVRERWRNLRRGLAMYVYVLCFGACRKTVLLKYSS